MIIPDKNTTFFFSISNNTSTRGSNFYNKLFEKKKKNSLYIPIDIYDKKTFEKFINFLKSGIVNVYGISISMPFKFFAQKFSDITHKSSTISQNTNTLVFKKKKIYAYNSDYLAAKKILKNKNFENYIILGAGSLSLTFISLLKKKNIFLFNRTAKNTKKLINKYKNIVELKKSIKKINNVCVINATPKHNHNKLLKLVDFSRIKYICDCVIADKSELNIIAKKYSINYTSGDFFYKCQRSFQQKIYLNEKI